MCTLPCPCYRHCLTTRFIILSTVSVHNHCSCVSHCFLHIFSKLPWIQIVFHECANAKCKMNLTLPTAKTYNYSHQEKCICIQFGIFPTKVDQCQAVIKFTIVVFMIGLTLSAVYWGRVTISALLRIVEVGVAVTVGCSVADGGDTKIGQGMCMNKDGHGFKIQGSILAMKKYQ